MNDSAPPRPRPLVGRERELAHALAELSREREGGAIMLLGPGGIGKTTLAAELARRLEPRFEHGCAWVDVQRIASRRVDAVELAAAVLDALGASPADDHAGWPHAIASARDTLRTTHVLLVLDGVEDEGQVRDLLPRPGWRCSMIVTARRSVHLDARAIVLEALSLSSGVELLRAAAQHAPSLDDRDLCTELVRAVGGQPLAIALVGARLAQQPDSARDLLHQLRNEATRSSFTDAESAPATVRGVLAATYEQLSDGSAMLLRLIGLLSADRVTINELHHLSSLDTASLRGALEELAAARLVDVDERSCRVHPLVRRFAREQLGDEDIDSAAAALVPSHLIAPDLDVLRGRLRVLEQANPRERSDRIDALGYALRVATATGDLQAMTRALANLGVLHGAAGHQDDAAAALRTGLAIAQQAGDVAMVAQLALALGQAEQEHAALGDAQALYELSARSFEQLGDARGRAHALMALGDVDGLRGRYDAARDLYETALAELPADDVASRVRAFARLADTARELGDVERARALYTSVLRETERSDAHAERADVELQLGLLEARSAHVRRARELLLAARDRSLHAGSSRGAALAVLALGILAVEGGDREQAREHFEHAAELADALGPWLSARAAYGSAIVTRELGGLDRAVALLELALAHFRKASDDVGEAHALAALAAVLRERGEIDDAHAAQRTAEALFERLDERPLGAVEALRAMTLGERT